MMTITDVPAAATYIDPPRRTHAVVLNTLEGKHMYDDVMELPSYLNVR